jgi:hypothetical protein
MPSYLHEVLVEMFRDRPALAAELLAGPLGIPVPDFKQATLSPGELTDVAPTEYRADAVVTLKVHKKATLAVVIEAQLRIDTRKRRSWPAYVATLHARLDCPVALLVVCSSPVVANWCATPIVVHDPGMVLRPFVLGPDQVPVVTDPAVATSNPQLAVLSAIAHGSRRDHASVLDAMLAGLNVVDHAHANLYADIVLRVLPQAARRYLEDALSTKTHPYQSNFARRYYDQGEAAGEAKGEARAVLAFLEARGIEVPNDVRERILVCTDLSELDTWVSRAATATKVQELFE